MEFVLKNEEDNQPDLEIFDTLKSLDALNHGYSLSIGLSII